MNRPVRKARTVDTERETLVSALLAGGSVMAAAGLLGIKESTMYQRLRRAGVNTRRVLYERADALAESARTPPPPPPAGTVLLAGDEVRMSLADYTLLRSMAAGYNALGDDDLKRALAVADRIIDTLARELARFKESS